MDKKAKKGRNLRSIFWLLCLKSLQVKRPQAILGIGSLVVGAAVCSLLLNLYGGVQHKMTESFRSFGPNVIFAPREAASQSSSLPSVMEELPAGRFDSFRRRFPGLAVVPVLYVVAHINPAVPDPLLPDGENVLAVGANLDRLLEINPDWRVQGKVSQFEDLDCLVGSHLATEMGCMQAINCRSARFVPTRARRRTLRRRFASGQWSRQALPPTTRCLCRSRRFSK
jgi:hypothetical protein